MESIQELKYAIFDEWTYDPPGGQATYYYPSFAETFSDLLDPVEEIIEHVIEATGGEEEIITISPDEVNSADDIMQWSWDNGGVGCGCVLYAEGEDIIDAVTSFYYDTLEEYAYDYFEEEMQDDEDDEELEDGVPAANRIIKTAKNNPQDYDALEKLIDFISELIEVHNNSMY